MLNGLWVVFDAPNKYCLLKRTIVNKVDICFAQNFLLIINRVPDFFQAKRKKIHRGNLIHFKETLVLACFTPLSIFKQPHPAFSMLFTFFAIWPFRKQILWWPLLLCITYWRVLQYSVKKTAATKNILYNASKQWHHSIF